MTRGACGRVTKVSRRMGPACTPKSGRAVPARAGGHGPGHDRCGPADPPGARTGSPAPGEAAAAIVDCSPSRISRIESGEIRPRVGDVMELLVAYGVKIDEEPGTSLLDQARGLREDGWWQRLGGKYATYIAYEIEAVELKNFEPMLVPGLLQTESYAREVNVIGRETDPDTVDQRVSARMTRQEVLRRKPTPLRMHAILSEASVRTEVGGPDVLREQLDHLVALGRLPNVTIQVLRFEAGAHLADSSGFALSALSGMSRHWATSKPWQAHCSLSRAVTWRGCRRRTTI
nr:helix-turn-helix transcriptional regulator [Micromonospora sp. C81]